MKQMNRYGLWLGMMGGLLPMAGYADPTLFTDGISFDSANSMWIGSVDGSLAAANENNGIFITSQKEESYRGAWDGGIMMMASPVSVLLSTSSSFNSDRGAFSVWGEAEYWDVSTGKAFFEIKSPENTAAFDSVDVTVTNGSLSVGGSPVLTAGGLNAALSTATPPTSAAWTAAYVPKGSVSNGGYLAMGGTASATGATAFGPSSVASGTNSYALGQTAKATGANSYAIGVNTTASGITSTAGGNGTTASGQGSFAHGAYNTASGRYSVTFGDGSTASGHGSIVMGGLLEAQSRHETVIGVLNSLDPSPSPTNYVMSDALFRIGNGGLAVFRSDAVTVRKHGETTLTNVFWKLNSANPLADPTAPDDAGGSALVVDGHTTLNGKVTISAPQGDISMGIYQ